VKYLLFTCLIFLTAPALSQDDVDTVSLEEQDTSLVPADTTYEEEYEYDESISHHSTRGADDSVAIAHRRFSESKIDTLRSDPDMQYDVVPTVAESLWERLMNFIKDFFTRIFRAATGTSWGRLFLYIGGFVLVVALIILVFKVNALKLFYGSHRTDIEEATFHENIHEMDFDALIAEATMQNDYRKGIRLVFLYALKLLSDKQLIDWERGKTNHDYVAELKKPELKEGFNALSYYFDYAWYGNFKVSHEIFRKVEHIFTNWKGNIR